MDDTQNMDDEVTEEGSTDDETKEYSQEEKQVKLPADLPFEAINLVPDICKIGETDEEYKKFIKTTVPEKVCREFAEDWESTEEYRKNRAARLKLILGDLDPKTFPWENCANGHLPIMLKSGLRISTRIYSEIFPDNDVMANCEKIGDEDTSRAVTLFMNRQFLKVIPDFKVEIRRALFEFIMHGEAIFDSYHDFSKGVDRHEHLGCEDLVFPYTWKSTAVDMSDVPRKTKILRKYRREIEQLEKDGTYCGFKEILEKKKKGEEGGAFSGEIDYIVKDVLDKFEGKHREDTQTDTPYTILEYHGWLQFPNEDFERPVVISLEYSSQKVIGLYTRETEDIIDLARFQKQQAEYDSYVQAVEGYTQATQEELNTHDMLSHDAVPDQEELALREATMADPLPMPTAPDWFEMDDQGHPKPPKPAKKIPIERFSRRSCIENPEGSLGLGFGTMLMPFNEAADTLVNQFVDSATRNNVSTLIADETLFPAGTTNISPGQVLRVRNFNSSNIGDRVFELKSQPANGQLIQLAQMMEAEASEIASAPSIMSGEKDGPETYRGQAGRIEQATKQQSVVASNFIELLTNLMKNQARLNSQFLPEQTQVMVLDPKVKQYVSVNIRRDMFLDDFETEFTADIRFASKAQKIAEADDTLAMLMKAVPLELMQKLAKPQIIAHALRKCLKARGQEDLLSFVNTDEEVTINFAPPPMPPGMPGMPPGAPMPPNNQPGGAAPPPSIPDGQSGAAPGTVESTARPPDGSPVESGAGQ